MVKIYNTPSHRAQLGEAIAKAGCATAMIDTSDGFLGDLGHICEESGVGAELFKEKLPVSEDLREAALMLHRDPYDFFLGDSDDYELVITCRPQDVALAPFRCYPVLSCPVDRSGEDHGCGRRDHSATPRWRQASGQTLGLGSFSTDRRL